MALDKTTQNLQNATASIARFEEKLIDGERHSRCFNVRLLGARELADEDFINITWDQIALTGNIIENAHSTGTPSNDNPRYVIARFYSRVTRCAVLRAARGNLTNTYCRLIEDVT